MDVPGRTRTSAHDVEELITALDNLPGMVAYWDRELRNHIANAAYLEWFGIAPEDMRGMHIRDVLGPEVYEKNLPYIRGALAGEKQLFNRTLVDAYGRSRYTQASYIPYAADGVVQGFFVLVTDISERVAAEEALKESVAQVALLQERERVAADLHDTVIQDLYAANIGLSTLMRGLDLATARRANAIIERIDGAIRSLRSAIQGTAIGLGSREFTADLAQVVEQSTLALGFTPTMTTEGPTDLIPVAALPAILAVLREALSNVARHAHATHVAVTLTTIGPEVRLVITDNGRGIGATGRSSGLANMRVRAERLGGEFTHSDNDPHGTIIDWRIPSTLADQDIRIPQAPPHSQSNRSADARSSA